MDLGNKSNNLKHNELYGQKEAEWDGRSIQLLKLRCKGPGRDPLSSIQIKGCPSEQEFRGGVIRYGTFVSGARLINYHWWTVTGEISPLAQNQIMLSQNHALQEILKALTSYSMLLLLLAARSVRCSECREEAPAPLGSVPGFASDLLDALGKAN